MNKKEYEKPAMRVVKIAMTSIICTSVTGLDSGDTGIGYGGGGDGTPSGGGSPRAPIFNDWDVWEE